MLGTIIKKALALVATGVCLQAGSELMHDHAEKRRQRKQVTTNSKPRKNDDYVDADWS